MSEITPHSPHPPHSPLSPGANWREEPAPEPEIWPSERRITPDLAAWRQLRGSAGPAGIYAPAPPAELRRPAGAPPSSGSRSGAASLNIGESTRTGHGRDYRPPSKQTRRVERSAVTRMVVHRGRVWTGEDAAAVRDDAATWFATAPADRPASPVHVLTPAAATGAPTGAVRPPPPPRSRGGSRASPTFPPVDEAGRRTPASGRQTPYGAALTCYESGADGGQEPQRTKTEALQIPYRGPTTYRDLKLSNSGKHEHAVVGQQRQTRPRSVDTRALTPRPTPPPSSFVAEMPLDVRKRAIEVKPAYVSPRGIIKSPFLQVNVRDVEPQQFEAVTPPAAPRPADVLDGTEKTDTALARWSRHVQMRSRQGGQQAKRYLHYLRPSNYDEKHTEKTFVPAVIAQPFLVPRRSNRFSAAEKEARKTDTWALIETEMLGYSIQRTAQGIEKVPLQYGFDEDSSRAIGIPNR